MGRGDQAGRRNGNGRGVDLSEPAKSLDEQRLDHERKLGMRCGGCKGRIGLGFEFVMFAVVEVPGARDRLASAKAYACTREDCDYAETCMRESNAVRQIEWSYLDELRGEKVPGAVNEGAEFEAPVDGPPDMG